MFLLRHWVRTFYGRLSVSQVGYPIYWYKKRQKYIYGDPIIKKE